MKAQPLVTVQSLRSRPIASSSIAAVAPRATIHQRQGADSPAGAFTAPSTDASSAHGLKPADSVPSDEPQPTAQSAPATHHRKPKRSCLLPGGHVDQAAFERLARNRIGGLS